MKRTGMSEELVIHAGSLAHESNAQMVVQLGSTVREVLSAMHTRKASAAYVVDDTGRLCGSISHEDLERIEPGSTLENLQRMAQCAPTKFVMVDAPIVEVFRLMNKDNLEVLPVVDGNKTLQGFIALDEIRQHLSPERIYPSSLDTQGMDENVERHVARYRFSSQFIGESDIVLDCACGSGYGSAILAEKCAAVIGVDISEEAILFALETYARKNIQFCVKDLKALSFESEYLDAVVCLETMEHLPFDDCREFMLSAQKWVKRGGLIVASSPMLRFNDGKPFVTNPHHVNEMPREMLLDFFTENFPGFVIQCFHQEQNTFVPLIDENTGFCIVVARKKWEL